jgi:protease PrsW
MRIGISLIPVFLFLVILIYLDSFRLVRINILLLCLGWGILSALLSYFLNTFLIRDAGIPFQSYSAYIAPIAEETLKMLFLVLLIRKNRIGFMIDGAIYGFAIGAGFAVTENLAYLHFLSGNQGDLILWIIRGFGTAVMHGGATAIVGILMMGALNRHTRILVPAVTGTLGAILLHAVYNTPYLSPVTTTLLILVIIPVSIILIFRSNEKSLRDWLELQFDSEVQILAQIRQGKFTSTRAGVFLLTIKDRFPKEIVFDLYCFISLYLELSIKAKSLLMLRESGLPASPEPGIPEKLAELRMLRKSIGNAGYLAISPVLRVSRKDLWKISLLGT